MNTHQELFQSERDIERQEMTITQDDFVKLCTVIKTMRSFNNNEAMQKVLAEADNTGVFEGRAEFTAFCTLFTPTTSMGSTLFNQLYPHLGEDASALNLALQIKNIETDVERGDLITNAIQKFGPEKTSEGLQLLIYMTNREKDSEYAPMPISFLERCLKECNSLEEFLEKAENANKLVKDMPLISMLGRSLTLNEIVEIAGLKSNEGDTLETILQNLKAHLGDSSLIYAKKMIKEMQKNGLVNNKKEVAEAAKAVLDITNIANNIIKNLPNYPENTEYLNEQFTDLLVELKFFKERYGDNPQARSVLHHLLSSLSSDRNLNLLVDNNEPYQRDELKFFMSALRRMEKYSADKIKPVASSSEKPAINIELQEKVNSDERNILLVDKAFQAADTLIQLQKEHEAQQKELEELKQLASELTEVSTHAGHRPIETIQTSNAINKLNVSTKLKIAGLNFQIAVLSFCEVFHKYPPRQRLIEKLEKQITNLRLGKASEQDELEKNLTPAPDEGGIRTKPEDRPPPPTETLAPPKTKERPAPPPHQAPGIPEDDDNAPKKQ